MSLCLASAAVAVTLGWSTFTLAWTHSVERIEWQEDWRVTTAGLEIVEARVKGTGAGMEPPADARLVDGWWRYHPPLAPLHRLVLARSDVTSDWRLCRDGGCLPLDRLIEPEPGPVALYPCPE